MGMSPKETQDTIASLLAEAKKRKEDTALLEELFSEQLPSFEMPNRKQWNTWLRRCDAQVVALAIAGTAEQFDMLGPDPEGGEWTLEIIIRYISGIIKRLTGGR